MHSIKILLFYSFDAHPYVCTESWGIERNQSQNDDKFKKERLASGNINQEKVCVENYKMMKFQKRINKKAKASKTLYVYFALSFKGYGVYIKWGNKDVIHLKQSIKIMF